ncbi:unnamed protein product, partial [Pocillopora meandrina]
MEEQTAPCVSGDWIGRLLGYGMSTAAQLIHWLLLKMNVKPCPNASCMPTTQNTETRASERRNISRCIGRIIPDDTKRARVCENHKMSLECPERRNIDIVWANFGRLKGAHICGDGFFGIFSWNQACQHQVASKAIAKQYCQDKEH